MIKQLKILMLISALFIISGCRSANVYNVENVSIGNNNANESSLFYAVERAVLSKGWQVKRIKPGLAEAFISLRKHSATVLIEYSNSHYSINYKDSNNLKYNESKQTIHKNYNGWIQNLEKKLTLTLNNVENRIVNNVDNAIVNNKMDINTKENKSSSKSLRNNTEIATKNVINGKCKFSFTGSLMRGRNFKTTKIINGITKSAATAKAISVLTSSGYVISSFDANLGIISGTEPKRGYSIVISALFQELENGSLLSKFNVVIPSGISISKKGAKDEMCRVLNSI